MQLMIFVISFSNYVKLFIKGFEFCRFGMKGWDFIMVDVHFQYFIKRGRIHCRHACVTVAFLAFHEGAAALQQEMAAVLCLQEAAGPCQPAPANLPADSLMKKTDGG